MTADGDGVGLRGGIGPQESFLDLFQAEQLRQSLETIGPGESLRQKCVALKEIVEDKQLTRMGVNISGQKGQIFLFAKLSAHLLCTFEDTTKS